MEVVEIRLQIWRLGKMNWQGISYHWRIKRLILISWSINLGWTGILRQLVLYHGFNSVLYAIIWSTGAVSSFLGTTRDSFEGRTVTHLEYECYPEMALEVMRNICKEVWFHIISSFCVLWLKLVIIRFERLGMFREFVYNINLVHVQWGMLVLQSLYHQSTGRTLWMRYLSLLMN